MPTETTRPLHPPRIEAVVATTPRELTGREGVAARRAAAEAAVRAAAARAGGSLEALPVDDRGAPLPVDGLFWSLAHTAGLGAGAAARAPVGIDVEWLGRRRLEAVAESLTEEERGLLKAIDSLRLLRAWTAKEAVLKMRGVGVAGLPFCRLTSLARYGRVELEYEGAPIVVRQDLVLDHVVSVACDLPSGFELACVLLEEVSA